MSIDIQHGNIETVLALAANVGEARKEERAIERAEAIGSQIRSIKAQQELAEFNAQIDMEKAKFNSMMSLESQKRAQLFELEKLEVEDRMDFARKERERNRKADEYDATIKYIEERDDLTAEQKKAYGFKAYMKKQGVTVSESLLLPEQKNAGKETPSVTNKISAIRELNKDVYKKPGFVDRITPKWLGGKKDIDPALKQQKAFLESVVGINDEEALMNAADQTMKVEPATLQEFEATVIELGKIDKAKADAYFKKYTSKFD